MLDHLQKADHLVLSFIFDFSDIIKQTLDGMLRSLAFQLFQLFQGDIGFAHQLDYLFQAHQHGGIQPATKTLEDFVNKTLLGQKILIVLDALDESITRGELLRWIKNLVSLPELAHIKLFCTSRPETEFQNNIPGLIGD